MKRTVKRPFSAGRAIRRTCWIVVGAALVAAVTRVPLAPGSAAGTFPLRAVIPWRGTDGPCDINHPLSVACHPHPGGPVAVPGLGFVSQSYVYAVETAPRPGCQDGFTVLSYPARLTVRGRGEIFLAVATADGCLFGPPLDTVLRPRQAFTVTGGSGVYAGASGSGVVSRPSSFRQSNGRGGGIDIWEGTLVAPSLEFDTTPPKITGAVAKIVRAPRKATRVRVRYQLAATDNVDGAVPVMCQPRSGSRFKVGRRAVVRCSATDTSANTTRASFAVTIRPAR